MSSSTGDHLSVNDNIIINLPPQTPIIFSSGSNNDEIRKKRMISNRESARRSRMRKQKHLEDVKNQVTKYKMVNQQLMNRLRLVNHNGHIVEQQNKMLRFESAMLRERLCHLQRLLARPEFQCTLLSSAWPCNNIVTL
ncbi:hypothetical protein QVD17_24939 [Tagetes erecta]|uniref:BZIP domain-containing protein n=1 Tax=Tagetes erecta TaxID=13708 RepID=A0AAD8NV92_TARER|nr:hypothetical protein QVD17_24939 [Tagetes erecta]